jgi:hypothetical protein
MMKSIRFKKIAPAILAFVAIGAPLRAQTSRFDALADAPFKENRPNIPAANFWSVTLYEAENASGLANGQAFPSLGSRDKPQQNVDGSTDLYLGPKAPEGKASNWLATVPGKGYFAIIRLYGPTEAAIQKSWKPGDLEKIK